MTWHDRHRVMRRATAGRTLVLGIFGILTLVFFRVQVINSSRYQLQSEENRLRPVPLRAPRGLITDRDGEVLVDNVPGYTIAVLASDADSLRATLDRVANILRLDSTRIDELMRRYRRARYEPVVIERNVPFELVSVLEEWRVLIPGLVVQTEPKRRYPYADTLAHVIGYVAEITEAELNSGLIPGARNGTLIGRYGLENQYDLALRGQDGVRFVEVDALGRTVSESPGQSTLEAQQGDTIRTTLDVDLQRYVAQTFPVGRRGALVAMDPRTGDVLAMYSAPTFDPNAFVGGMDTQDWRMLSQADDKPLFNRAIQGLYPPASPWKLMVAGSALRRGLVTPETHMEIPCRGGLQFGNRYFRCWRERGHGDLTLREAIQFSCDVYFYQLGLRLELETLLQDGTQMGFSELTGIDLPGEVQPVYPASTDYFDRKYGPRGWTQAVTLNLAIGQGENSQTLLGMVRFYAMLANAGGAAPPPRLVATGAPASRSLGLGERHLAELRRSLLAVVEEGTAARSRIAELRMAGKTGTAQNPHGPSHGWFIGFAPWEDPQIVVGAIVEFAEHGSDVAPLVANVMGRHLMGEDAPTIRSGNLDLVVPADSAPAPLPILPDSTLLRSSTPRRTRT